MTEPLATATAAPARGKLSPLSPGPFALQATVDQARHAALCQAQELLGHSAPSDDLATVIKSAALTYVELLERKKFAQCRRPRSQRVPATARHVPAEVKRKVWARDGGQHTFVSEHGKRCEAHSCSCPRPAAPHDRGRALDEGAIPFERVRPRVKQATRNPKRVAYSSPATSRSSCARSARHAARTFAAFALA